MVSYMQHGCMQSNFSKACKIQGPCMENSVITSFQDMTFLRLRRETQFHSKVRKRDIFPLYGSIFAQLSGYINYWLYPFLPTATGENIHHNAALSCSLVSGIANK